jgi:protein kinase/serine/threonine-protein kinase
MSEQNELPRLVAVARSHRLWQTLGVYLVASWVALQVVDFLAQNFGLPDWFPAFAVALLVIGLPIVLATAIIQASPVVPPVATPSEVKPSSALDAPQSVEPVLPSSAHRLFTWRNAILGGVLAFALWGVVAAVWLVVGGRDAARTVSGADGGQAALRTVAVLPFDNLSADQENAFFADGIHEDVLTQLSKIEDLTIISRTSVMGYRETTKNLSDIGRELGAGAIVEGSVRRAGDNVRITAQLIDASTDEHLWADNFDRALTAANIFSIQTEIAQRIAKALTTTLSPEVTTRIERQPTEDLMAYDATLRGRERYRLYTEEANTEAIRLFRTSVDRDPSYAEPWAGLADAYGQRVLRYGYGIEWADSAEAAARHAIELDPELASAHKALALAHVAEGDLNGSLEANLRAVELAPNNADAINNVGATYQRMGRLAENLRWTKRSFALQPNQAFSRTNLASAYMQLREYEIARRILDDALALEPDADATLQTLAQLHWFTGNDHEAAGLAERLVEVAPDDPVRIASAANFLSFTGRDERALELARRGLELSPDQGVLYFMHLDLVVGRSLRRLGQPEAAGPSLQRDLERTVARARDTPDFVFWSYSTASIYAALERLDEALDWLGRASDAGFRGVHLIERDPVWDPLRDDPRFQGILAEVSADVERMRSEIEREETGAGER